MIVVMIRVCFHGRLRHAQRRLGPTRAAMVLHATKDHGCGNISLHRTREQEQTNEKNSSGDLHARSLQRTDQDYSTGTIF
jgi:hypothetical protein